MWVWMNGVSTTRNKLERGWIYCHARSRIVILNRSLFIIFVLNREPEGLLWRNPIYALVDVYFFHYLFRSWVDDEAITHTIFSLILFQTFCLAENLKIFPRTKTTEFSRKWLMLLWDYFKHINGAMFTNRKEKFDKNRCLHQTNPKMRYDFN